jgi:heme-degrading monooxygenase HmoA
MFRVFTQQQPDERRFEKLRSEMIPQLRNIPGFQRFAALRTNDGRYGGFSVYDTKEAADQAAKMLNDWREKAGNRDPVAIEARGETGMSIVVNQRFEKGYGVARIYRTDASFDQVNAAIEQEAGETIRNLPGLLRYTTVKFEDGRIATLSACETQQAARNLTDKARELRSKAGSQLKKTLPNDPEVIEGEIMLAVMK